MSITFDKEKGVYRFKWERKIGGKLRRATSALPKGTTREQAQAFDDRESRRLFLEAGNPDAVTLAEVMARYVTDRVLGSKHPEKTANHIANMAPLLDGLPVTEVAEAVKRIKAKAIRTPGQKEKPWGPATIRQRLAYLKAALRAAHREWEMVDQDYSGPIVMPTVRNARHKYKQLPALLELCARIDHLPTRAAVTLAFCTGIRQGLLVGPGGALPDQVVNNAIYVELTKNDDPVAVPVAPIAQWALAYLPLTEHPRTYYRRYEAARDALGWGDFTWHDLRHCCASILLNQGVGLETVARILGHRSMASTRRYAHLVMDAKRAAIDSAFALQENEPLEMTKGLPDEGNPFENSDMLVGRARFELATNGLKVRCSTG